ncbi:MAG: phosphomannomutase/phosphoglucomutase [Methylococcales bacterium]
MVRLFSLLAAITAMLTLLAGIGVQLLGQHSVVKSRQHAAEALAHGIAVTLAGQIDMLDRTLAKMAQDPDLIAAVTNRDSAQLSAQALKLEKHFPDALKIRLLLPGVSDVDKNSLPHMGFADLDMVKESFNSKQPINIHGDEGPDRHLAMTQRIMNNNQVAGVILASLKYDFISKTIKTAKIDDSYIELKQDKLTLGAVGDSTDKEGRQSAQQQIPGTSWTLHYWYDQGTGFIEAGFIIAMIVIPVLLALLAFFVIHRRLSLLLSQDISTIMKAFKDLMGNKPQTNYPINLVELNAIIPTLVQFKRVVESNEIIISETDDFELNGFFSESGNDDLLEKVINDDLPAIHAPKAKPEPQAQAVEAASKRVNDFSTVFRAYDIRGIVNETLTEKNVKQIGRALGTVAVKKGCKTIVVGRDGRNSSPMLSNAVIEGIISTGCEVMDIGMIPTPVLYFVAQHVEGRSGVMITGSHNPPEYNGLKMVINGDTLAGDKIQLLKHIIEQQDFTAAAAGKITQNKHFVDEYIGIISEDIALDKSMKIVMDCGNGVTGTLGPLVLRTLGCEVIELFTDIDGSFPNHHPDPSNPDNMADLIGAVKFYQADLGIAFDGDGDRLGVVDNEGKIIWADRQMMLFAKDVLAGKPGSEVIYDVKCSNHLATQISKFGGRATMWKSGHSFMKAKLKETGAKLAGEMSGHIYFNDRWFGFDDALYAAARLIEILSKDSRSSAEVFADYPDGINTPELTIAMQEGENATFMAALISAANFAKGKVTTIDGLRVDFANGWGLVRASNTTPSLVVRFEADSPEALMEIQDQFTVLMTQIKPDIVLPY